MTYIIGADEVGYGPLAGPVVVCAIKAPSDWKIDGLADSKKLSPKRREAICEKLNELIVNQSIKFALAERSNIQIDKVGVYVALKDCFVECFQRLYDDESSIIVDGNLKFDNLGVDDYRIQSVVKADNKFPAVMAASIFAKTYRDKKMAVFHQQYPQYGWDSNAGYGSQGHLAAIEKHGPSPLHRMSYAPMKNMKIEDPRQLKLF